MKSGENGEAFVEPTTYSVPDGSDNSDGEGNYSSLNRFSEKHSKRELITLYLICRHFVRCSGMSKQNE